MRVYIVEDNAMLQGRLREAFSDISGVEVVGCAVDAASAIRDLPTLKPDLITLDLWLKAGTGFDVLRWLGTYPGNRPECVVLTSHTDAQHIDQATRLGATHYMDKARDIPALLEFMRGRASATA